VKIRTVVERSSEDVRGGRVRCESECDCNGKVTWSVNSTSLARHSTTEGDTLNFVLEIPSVEIPDTLQLPSPSGPTQSSSQQSYRLPRV
jgi:hypothetical protein